MSKKCKCCNKSNLGAVVTVKQTAAVRILDGKITEQFQGSETEESVVDINFCFECNKAITENDLYENVECPICGNMVDHLVESGSCQECSDEANKLLTMSKEQLILMLMKQAKNGSKEVKQEVKQEAKPETTNQLSVKKEEPISNEEKVVIDDTSILEDSLNVKEQPKKPRKKKEKEEPVNPSVEEVAEAKDEIKEKVEAIATDVANKVPSTDESSVKDDALDINLNQLESSIPNENIDVDDLLNELDNINLDSEIF